MNKGPSQNQVDVDVRGDSRGNPIFRIGTKALSRNHVDASDVRGESQRKRGSRIGTKSCTAYFHSRFGTLQVVSDGEALTGLLLPSQFSVDQIDTDPQASVQVLQDACQQLRAFFEGELTTFDLPLAPTVGTEFQRAVWSELCRVPFGTTISYTQLAARVGRPSAVRAVGAANGRNPIPIIVPCHRVVGANGSLTGYAGGVELKRQLLDHEASCQREGSGATMLC